MVAVYDIKFAVAKQSTFIYVENQLECRVDWTAMENVSASLPIGQMTSSIERLVQMLRYIKQTRYSFKFEWNFHFTLNFFRGNYIWSIWLHAEQFNPIKHGVEWNFKRKNIILQCPTSFSHCTLLFIQFPKEWNCICISCHGKCTSGDCQCVH